MATALANSILISFELDKRPTLTAEDAKAWLEENPDAPDKFQALKTSSKGNARKQLREATIPQAFIDVVMPAGRAGRPPNADGPWHDVSAPVQKKIAEALGVDEIKDLPAEFWDVETIAIAVDTIIIHYDNSVISQSLGLSRLRSALKSMGVPKEVLLASGYRPEVTEAANSLSEARRADTAEKGVNRPDEFGSLRALTERAKAFIANPVATPQSVADFLVIFSARPGEVETIQLTERGTVSGMLKKRSAGEVEFPLVSALGEELATEFFKKFRSLSATARKNALRGLGPLTAQWGMTPRDLRAIGAEMATWASAALNAASADQVRIAALRHVQPAARAVDHYNVSNEKPEVAALCRLARELTVEDLEAILSEARSRAASVASV